MPFNGTGGFDPLPPPTYPAIAGDTIRAAYFNAVIDDIRLGLGQVLPRDGQSAITGDIDLAGNKFFNAADGTAPQDYTTLSQNTAAYLGRGVGSWLTSADVPTPKERLFFTQNAETSIRGHGSSPVQITNASNTVLAIFRSDGRATGSADGTAPEDFTRLGQVTTAISAAAAPITAAATAAATTAAQATQLGGVGQTYQDVTGSRGVGGVYTNSTARPIIATVTGVSSGGFPQQGTIQALVDGVTAYYISPFSNAGGYEHTVSFVVPVGMTYQIVMSNLALSRWIELRD